MSTLTMTAKQNAWLKGETVDPAGFSREQITVKSGESVVHGEVVGKVTKSTPTTGTAGGSNTGNGTCESVTASAKAKLGTYTLSCIEAVTNSGKFSIAGPDGYALPDAEVGTAYTSAHINFTLADGTTDFVVGDTFTIEITNGSGEAVPIDFTAVDGTQEAYGIMFDAVDASSAAKAGVIISRNAQIQSNHLTWPTGITSTQKTNALAELAAKGIINSTEV